jgi:hypothetical protein
VEHSGHDCGTALLLSPFRTGALQVGMGSLAAPRLHSHLVTHVSIAERHLEFKTPDSSKTLSCAQSVLPSSNSGWA